MECRDFHRKIPEYLAGCLAFEFLEEFENHLGRCPRCRSEVESFKNLDMMINEARQDVPSIELTSKIMKEIMSTGSESTLSAAVRPGSSVPKQTGKRNARRKRAVAMLPDLIAAAAAAIIIFWFSGPVLQSSNSAPPYAEEVVKVSGSVGGIFQSYLGLYSSGMERLQDSINGINSGHMKGDERF